MIPVLFFLTIKDAMQCQGIRSTEHHSTSIDKTDRRGGANTPEWKEAIPSSDQNWAPSSVLRPGSNRGILSPPFFSYCTASSRVLRSRVWSLTAGLRAPSSFKLQVRVGR